MAEYFAHPHPRSPFSEAVRVGDTLYLSALIGIDEDGRLADGFNAEVAQIMTNATAVLSRHGLSLNDVVKATVMLTDMGQWRAFNHLWRPYFAPDRLPVRTAFGVTELACGAQVEIEFWAHFGEPHT